MVHIKITLTNEERDYFKDKLKDCERLKQRFEEEGFEACIDRKPYPEKKEVKADGDFEAHLGALSCSEALLGFTRWSLRFAH